MSRSSEFDDVREFLTKFGYKERIIPGDLDPVLSDARIKHLREELDEYVLAVSNGDVEKQFDALIDLVYIALGTAALHGFPWKAGWDEVHRANMSKMLCVSADMSPRGISHDVIKPEGWRPPDLREILFREILHGSDPVGE